ncbi:efflux RND transporter periplasmic adaptor subunit [Pseudomarimonas arenosa]|uniref:Efflux RND transporter periplasmic adaptor subunit n=1 Tax=Pseudomarimonas arenosa TaxID=2774145 RepID=A0AAW3ZN26_9GAMM|nr:efflux RND transporter periplasmic adaptor subunit [Pseudomarimonas arenosa]MBD8526939.1 efflux RND transporter periplasmic adaptor subunit [Pseudomarimonas arenosa]
MKTNRESGLTSSRSLTRAGVLLLAIGLAACGGGQATQDQAQNDDKVEAKEQNAGEGKGEKGKPEVKPVPVEVATIGRRDIEASYAGTAALEAPDEAQVVAKTSGVLHKLMVEEGDQVKAGQVLAQIDPERAQLEVQRTAAALRKIEAEFKRSSELFARKLVAADAHERLRFDVDSQRAAHELAKLELSYTKVEAPISGVIAQRMVKIGNLIQLNQAMFRIVDTQRLEAVLNVPERELQTLKSELPVSLTVDALPGRRFMGEIDRLAPVVDAATGTFRVTAEFIDPSGMLKPGMFGRINVVYERKAGVLSVPRVALLEEAAEPAVFTVADGKVVRTPVSLGYVNGEFAEVTSGLSEGDQVITAGKVAVRDGSKVEVINAAAVADTSTPSGDSLAGASE